MHHQRAQKAATNSRNSQPPCCFELISEHVCESVTGGSSGAWKASGCLRLALASASTSRCSPPWTRPSCPPTVLPPYIADISATLRALGVRGHVLQQVHTEGVRPKLAARLATLGLGSVT